MKSKFLDVLLAFICAMAIFSVVLLLVRIITAGNDSNKNHESSDLSDEITETKEIDENAPRIISTTKPGTFEGGGTFVVYAEGYGLVGTSDAYLNCSTAISKPLEVYSAEYPITITLAVNDEYKEFSLTAGDAKTLECESGSGYSVYLYVIVT